MIPFCTVPGRPKELRLEILNETAVCLSWASPDSPNGVILEYEVTYYGHKPVESGKVINHVLILHAQSFLNIIFRMRVME